MSNKSEKIKNFFIKLGTSEIFWAVISFCLIILFAGLAYNDYGWTWKSTMIIISSVFFAIFVFGSLGLSLFKLIGNLIKKN